MITHSEGDRDTLTINAVAGDDVIQARSLAAGALTLAEEDGDNNDDLIGSAGDDVILGSAGDGLLIGGPGNDTLDGGPDTNILIQ